MTRQAINLQDGLEVWYDFSDDYYDNQRDELEDKSGYGRVAKASGGPSIGVGATEGFKSATFDGNDDQFDVDLENWQADESFSVAILGKYTPDVGSDAAGFVGGGTAGSAGMTVQQFGNDVGYEFGVRDENDDENVEVSLSDADWGDEWIIGVGIYVPDERAYLKVSGQTATKEDEIEPAPSSDITLQTNDRTIGRDSPVTGDAGYLEGEIAFIGSWERELNEAEIEYLLNLTGPRRVQL